MATSRQYSYIGALCSQIGLDREDRLELCRRLYGYGYDLHSVKEMEDEHVSDLIHVLWSFQVIERLQMANGAFEVKAETFLDFINSKNERRSKEEEEALLDEEG